VAERSAYVDALHLLSRRELSVAQCRERLLEKGHSASDIDAAVERLLDTRALDDRRVARAYVRTAVEIKGRGRLRIKRELQARGIPADVAAEALADFFESADEPSLVSRAVQKRLRGRSAIEDRAEYGRLYRYLMRQGFTPSVVSSALRSLRGGRPDD
jgi:regulatory protein